jgi:hypothetical protein
MPGPAQLKLTPPELELADNAMALVVHVSVPPVALTAGGAQGVREKSSTAMPSSELVASRSFHRIQKVDPFATLIPEMAALNRVRFDEAFPSRAPAAPEVSGVTKLRLGCEVHIPVERLVASKLI